MKSKIFLVFSLIILSAALNAQTGGPGQPEFLQFQQAGTSNLVNPATGTFSYQVPLFTIGGYPMNLTYQSGILMEDVSSMVGLGWNLNAGSIVRTLRGLPDDFKYDVITKEFSVKPNETYGGKLDVDLEIAGLPKFIQLSVGAGIGVFYNNYKGWGVEHSLGGSLSACYQATKGIGGRAGIGMGVAANSQTGVEKYLSPKIGLLLLGGDDKINISLGKTWAVNSNEGLKTSLNTGLSYIRYSTKIVKDETSKNPDATKEVTDQSSMPLLGYSNRSYLNNSFQPDIDYPFENTSGTFSGSFGWDAYAVDPGIRVTGYYSKQTLAIKTQLFFAFGSMYESDKIPANSMMDFNREKKIPYYAGESKTLPVPYKTPDVFNLNAQGLSMTFSVNKNDIGVVGDAESIINSNGIQAGVEANLGILFKAGANIGTTTSFQKTGKWNQFNLSFTDDQDTCMVNDKVSLYQQFCFKNNGEINKFNHSAFKNLGNYNPISFLVKDETLLDDYLSNTKPVASYYNKFQPVRQTTINYMTAEEASSAGFDKMIKYYKFNPLNSIDVLQRVHYPNKDYPKKDHLSEISVTQPDGKKYIFGIPVYNTIQKEVTFNVGSNLVNCNNNLVPYNGTNNSTGNDKGIDHYFESTTTPPYVTQFLITAVLSPEYRDLTNDGITDDDIGNYVKFEYYKEDFEYQWRTPFELNQATYNQGLRSDPDDAKGTYVYGKKELYYIHSIESKTEIAEYYYIKRDDGFGVTDENGGIDPQMFLRKLDYIKVYSLPDRRLNGTNAVPIKTIHFKYDYSLCRNTNNSQSPGAAKLTLKEVAMTYENSQKGSLTPYVFEYGKSPGGIENPDYNSRDVNRWGYFQKNRGYSDCDNSSPLSNIDFPYASQNKAEMDGNAYAWNLTDITFPGEGKIKVDYEAHDYAYVQNKPAGQMFKVTGLADFNSGTYLDPNFDGNLIPDLNLTPDMIPIIPAHYRIFFKLLDPILSTDQNVIKREIKERYLFDIPLNGPRLYYKFFVKLKEDKYEYITGYATVKDWGIASDNHYAWVELEKADLDEEKANGYCNPVQKTALQFMRINRNSLIFDVAPMFNPGTDQMGNFINNLPDVMLALVAQMAASITGINFFCRNAMKYCSEIDTAKSFIRLYNPIKRKIAGGSRVSKISINDNFNTMTGNVHQNKSYSTSYFYNTDEVDPVTQDTLLISSGVAEYEPMVGGDEISLKSPVFYSDLKKKAPDNEFYVEEPVNESNFPAPQIIYSKVTQITNETGLNVGKTGKIVNEFYTAKDFPVIVKRTPVFEERDKTKFNAFQLPFVSIDQQHDFATVAQGYSIELNNMSGLPEATWVYNEKGVRISGEVNEYATDNNHFITIDSLGVIHKNTTLGLSVEYTIDGKKSYDHSVTNIKAANLNMIIIPIIPPVTAPIIVPLFSRMTEEKQFQSIVINKIIHRNALLKSKTIFSQTAAVTTENLAYDEVTGEALLTATTNEFSDKLFSFKYQAWWIYKGMGPSYTNTKLNFTGNNIRKYELLLKPGDELRSVDNGPRIWVNSISPLTLADDNNNNIPFLTSNYNYQVYNSGAKNLLNAPAGGVVTWNYNPLSNGDNISFNDTTILNSSVIQYYDSALNYCDYCKKPIPRLNTYLSGKTGNWKPKRSRFYLDERTPGDLAGGITNIRKQGLFKSYSDFWKLPTAISLQWNYDPLGWEWNENVNLTDANGQTIETEDRIGRKTAILLGYKNTLILAQATNASYNESFYDGFEDYFNSFCPGYIYYTDNCKRMKTVGSATIVNTESHTGKYSLQINTPLTLQVLPPTNECIGGFFPEKNDTCLFSCWVKVNKPQPVFSCRDAFVRISCNGVVLVTLLPDGPVIEGWQRVIGTFHIPLANNDIAITLNKGLADTYYDDLRIIPADGNMTSYVYDDVNLRLTYILDANNYFTKYEYDDQGKLVRIKKESEEGILTIQEGYQSLTKKQQ